MNKNLTILGLDPGTQATGYAILLEKNDNLLPIEKGVIQLNNQIALPDRIKIIYNKISLLIKQYHPVESSIEKIFYAKNVQSVLSLGEARGVIILALTENKIPVFEYTPREVKKAVVGNGNASKQQVQFMVKEILNLDEALQSFDVSDAIALAICHYYKRKAKSYA